jgi:hypothetical protein
MTWMFSRDPEGSARMTWMFSRDPEGSAWMTRSPPGRGETMSRRNDVAVLVVLV